MKLPLKLYNLLELNLTKYLERSDRRFGNTNSKTAVQNESQIIDAKQQHILKMKNKCIFIDAYFLLLKFELIY